MAASFYVTVKKKNGYATLFVRLQSSGQGVDIKMKTPLEVDFDAWERARKGKTAARENFRKAYPDIVKTIDELKLSLEQTETRKVGINKEQMKQIIDSVVFRKQREEEAQKLEEERKKQEAEKRMTLDKYITAFIKSAQNGSRVTNRGTAYSLGTIKAIKTCVKQFRDFQSSQKRMFDFDDIDMKFYYDFMAYLQKRQYNINSAGKIVKQLKTIMAAAESDGYHHNTIYKNPKFKGNRIDVDSIYLTMDDLNKIMAADISELEPAAEQVRDIFMVGVWTAQRVSDYNNISREAIHKTKKHWIEEVPDPEHEGETIPTIRTKEITYIDIIQQKTGAKVSVPCRKELIQILEKYDYNLPHVEDQTINRLIKLVAEKAGLDEPITIETTKGGIKSTETKPKYKLVMSHTARRTGATLMYLAGIEAYDIIKITGHGDIDILKKYIKADQLDVVQKLTDKYDYFD